MLDDEQREAKLLLGVQDEADHVLLFFLVHAGHGLVEHQEPRLRAKRAGELDPLLQPEGKDVDLFVAHAFQLQQVDDLFHLAPVGNLLLLRPPPVEERGQRIGIHEDVTAHQDVVEHAHAAKERDVLEGPRDAQAGDALRFQAVEPVPLEGDGALLRRIKAGDRIDERCLARSVRSHETEDLALANGYRYALERVQSAEPAVDILADEARFPKDRSAHAGRSAGEKRVETESGAVEALLTRSSRGHGRPGYLSPHILSRLRERAGAFVMASIIQLIAAP